jgi:hypothetical protein
MPLLVISRAGFGRGPLPLRAVLARRTASSPRGFRAENLLFLCFYQGAWGKGKSKNRSGSRTRSCRGAACCAPAWLALKGKGRSGAGHPQKEKGKIAWVATFPRNIVPDHKNLSSDIFVIFVIVPRSSDGEAPSPSPPFRQGTTSQAAAPLFQGVGAFLP